MLDRKRGKSRVHNERPNGLAVIHQLSQNVPMTIAWFKDSRDRLVKPRRNCRVRFGDREWALECARIGGDPEECPERQPRKPNKLGARERRFESRPARFVLLRLRMIRIQQQIGVDEHHR